MMAATDSKLIRAAETMLAERRARDDVFGPDRDGFGEPGWDMLLALYVGQRPMTWSEVTASVAHLNPTTADRYLEWLLSRALAQHDGAEIIIGERGRTLMTVYFEGLC